MIAVLLHRLEIIGKARPARKFLSFALRQLIVEKSTKFITIKSMVISLLPSGVRCQVGDLVVLALPSVALAKEGRLPKADLILHTKTKLPIEFPPSPETVAGAGEYEISGARVKGIGLYGEADRGFLRTIYAVELEGIRLVFLGEIEDESISDALDKLGAADILFLSVSDEKTKRIAALIKQIDPKIIIPTDDKTAKLLAEEFGQKIKAEEKLVIKKKDLEKEQSAHKVIWLKS